MNILKITTNSPNGVSQFANRKNIVKNTPETITKENFSNEVLTDSTETAGRSLVQFRSTFSQKDLNYIAEKTADLRLEGSDLSTFKNALSKTLKKYQIANLEELENRIGYDIDKSVNFITDVLKEAEKINPKANFDKIDFAVNAIF